MRKRYVVFKKSRKKRKSLLNRFNDERVLLVELAGSITKIYRTDKKDTKMKNRTDPSIRHYDQGENVQICLKATWRDRELIVEHAWYSLPCAGSGRTGQAAGRVA